MTSAPVYLDHNATTPIDPEVLEAMLPFFTTRYGNPSSVSHVYGNDAATAVERSRQQIAELIGARPEEIIFTGSCTEANNLAILGIARAADRPRHFVSCAIEHPSITEPFRILEREGHRVTYVGVDETGQVKAEEVAAAIEEDTLLVSVMAANNEVGTVQPLEAIGAACESRGVLFHSDLAQAAAYAPIDVNRLRLGLASLSAHKAYGPKGIGALYIRSRRPRIRLAALLFGGGQERGLRPGTLNVPLIVGLGAAFARVRLVRSDDTARLQPLRDRLFAGLQAAAPDLALNGHPTERLPNNLSISIRDVEPHALMRTMRDQVSFSASSACAAHDVKTSPVLLAMFGDGWRARNAFRLGLGRFTTLDDIDRAVEAFAGEVHHLRRVSLTEPASK
ncbi:MAG TPA: cysteine desulfurase family protein [Gemmatimonadaceae bacterium]|nr:cysteine desulfurase family protein [Gemmatimonadaceae bacterium]